MIAHHPAFREINNRASQQARPLSLFGAKPSGFTLIELLVVVAIIVVLLAVAIPTFRKAREAARRVVCTSHLRQLQIAWYTYAEDHDGSIVCGRPTFWHEVPYDTPWLTIGKPWLIAFESSSPANRAGVDMLMRTGALASYVGNVNVYRCPSQYDLPDAFQLPPWYRWLSPYGIVSPMNCMGPSSRADWEATFTKYHGPSRIPICITKLSQLSPPGPAQRMVFLDTGWPPLSYPGPADWSIMGNGVTTQRGWTLGGFGAPIHHNKGTTMSFADGSVRYWRWKDPRTIEYSQAVIDSALGVGMPSFPPDLDNRDFIEFCQAIRGRR